MVDAHIHAYESIGPDPYSFNRSRATGIFLMGIIKRVKEGKKKTAAVKKAVAEIRKSTSNPQGMPDATARNLNAIDRQHGGEGNRF